MVPDNRTRSNRYKQKHRKFHLHMRANFIVRVTEHWNRLLGEKGVAETPPLKIFRTCLDVILDNVLGHPARSR